MKLIIDIPRKVNERLRADYGHGYGLLDEDQRAIMEAIYKGKKVEETSKFAKGKDVLISRQAAIKAVSVGCEELRGVFYRCKKNINALPSAAPGWIPVSERLPEPNEKDNDGFVKAYLVQNARLISVARWDGNYWILWGYARVLENVIAWMPLPEPYKEDKHE